MKLLLLHVRLISSAIYITLCIKIVSTLGLVWEPISRQVPGDFQRRETHEASCAGAICNDVWQPDTLQPASYVFHEGNSRRWEARSISPTPQLLTLPPPLVSCRKWWRMDEITIAAACVTSPSVVVSRARPPPWWIGDSTSSESWSNFVCISLPPISVFSYAPLRIVSCRSRGRSGAASGHKLVQRCSIEASAISDEAQTS